MPAPEAFSRVLIDQALEESDWDLLDPHRVRFESSGRDGRADYVLLGKNGPLCVLEAKREDLDPYDAKEQARGYAENIQAPFIILSNGREHWFWNYDARRPARRLPHRTAALARRPRTPPPQESSAAPAAADAKSSAPTTCKPFKPDLTLRRYQIGAIDEVAQQFDGEGRRKFLLEMATGTGKTLLCAALIRRFLATRNAERVLFIVDRIELAKQTMEDFDVVLRGIQARHLQDRPPQPAELLGSSRRRRHHPIAHD